jgi:hypothetical protein
VVGETPSLGHAISDLLESSGVTTRLEYDVGAMGPLPMLHRRFPVVIAACNEPFCATVRRWHRGEFPHVTLVVVGARDPFVAGSLGIHVVPLPLVPGPFLSLVKRLLATRSHTPPLAAQPIPGTPPSAPARVSPRS